MQRTFTLQLVERGRPDMRCAGPSGRTNQERTVAAAKPGDVHLIYHTSTGTTITMNAKGVWQWVDSLTGRLLPGRYATFNAAIIHVNRYRSEAMQRFKTAVSDKRWRNRKHTNEE